MNTTIKNFSKVLLIAITIFSMSIISSCSKDCVNGTNGLDGATGQAGINGINAYHVNPGSQPKKDKVIVYWDPTHITKNLNLINQL